MIVKFVEDRFRTSSHEFVPNRNDGLDVSQLTGGLLIKKIWFDNYYK